MHGQNGYWPIESLCDIEISWQSQMIVNNRFLGRVSWAGKLSAINFGSLWVGCYKKLSSLPERIKTQVRGENKGKTKQLSTRIQRADVENDCRLRNSYVQHLRFCSSHHNNKNYNRRRAWRGSMWKRRTQFDKIRVIEVRWKDSVEVMVLVLSFIFPEW